MTYNIIADMAENHDLARRLTACAAGEAIYQPESWVAVHKWALAAMPGWADSWASGQAANIENLGHDESVITDAMILSAVQAINAQGQGG